MQTESVFLLQALARAERRLGLEWRAEKQEPLWDATLFRRMQRAKLRPHS
jgi:hypothetical protein